MQAHEVPPANAPLLAASLTLIDYGNCGLTNRYKKKTWEYSSFHCISLRSGLRIAPKTRISNVKTAHAGWICIYTLRRRNPRHIHTQISPAEGYTLLYI